MRSTHKLLWVILLLPLFTANIGTAFAASDGDSPDVTTRVARISFLRGEVQIRHADGGDWERAAQNLPIVEGDELATDANARIEIQFNRDNYLRLSENAYLKVTTLRDEGIALSLPNGTMNLRVLNFDKDRTFFEIDAPQSTVAVQKAGMYRIDAGDQDETRVRVTVTGDGQARIYSDNSGFTIRSGRTSELQLAGNYAGEWDTTNAPSFTDEFDNWALQRDALIAKRLRDAYYDQYYDRDIYGAEDLGDYGEWIHTNKYGYVWKPYGTAISSYDNWSPYRYGQWRWVPPYGWTWVNDEPWGWATYHHGRWVYDNGWYWSPYGQNRGQRSWWRPALVVVTYIANNVCWYPLPYDYGYYNYNRSTYVDRRRYNTTIVNNTTVVVNPTPTPSPNAALAGSLRGPGIPLSKIPSSGVVSVPLSEFGRGNKDFRLSPPEISKKALGETPSDSQDQLALPTLRDLNGKVSREIRAEPPQSERMEKRIKTGAMERKIGAPLDENLRTERIYNNRSPVEKSERKRNEDQGRGEMEMNPPVRDTGAVKRTPRPVYKREDNNSDVQMSPPIRSTGGKSDDANDARPVRKQRSEENDTSPLPPTYEPSQRREKREINPPQPRYDPPQREQQPSPQPPPREKSPPPQREPSPPQREPKSEPPPRKSEPQPEKQPDAPSAGKDRRNSKDN